jgi:N-acetylglucosamine kinase-like BadF-type ATPase
MSRSLPAVLAIDGGNSKTEVALVAADGTLLAQVRGGQSNPQVIGMDQAFGVLRDLVRATARQAGVGQGGVPVASHALACLAGADLPDEEQQLTELVRAEGWTTSSLVVNDTFAVLRAGLDDTGGRTSERHPRVTHPGIAVTCGAGINCVGVGLDGRTTRFLALGEISGDWGGGGDLGNDAMWWAVRAEDGRGRDTELRTAVPAYFGLATAREVTIGRYLEKISYEDLYGLVPVIFEVAERGDPVARDLLLRQADEICLMICTAARRLGLTDTAVPVVLGGGILTARNPLLSANIAQRLAERLPQAVTRVVDVPPIAGAALLALDYVGATPAAEQRLRASYR